MLCFTEEKGTLEGPLLTGGGKSGVLLQHDPVC
jgi:hypothetical protein